MSRVDMDLYRKMLLNEVERLSALLVSEGGEALRLEHEVQRRRQELKHNADASTASLSDPDEALSSALARHVEAELRFSRLSNLYAATTRLSQLYPSRAEALRAIKEILVDLVGAQELVVFRLTPEGLSPLDATGSLSAQHQPLDGLARRAVELGVPTFAQEPRPEEPLACIPLRLGAKVTGVIAILGLLPHKELLEPGDREILSSLSLAAAVALESSER